MATAGTMAGNRRPRAVLAAGQAPEPRGATAASAAPPVLFPSHCPEERKDVSSLLPFCLKGTRGGERILLAAACAIGTTAALGRADPLRPGRGAAASRCCRRCCCLRVLHSQLSLEAVGMLLALNGRYLGRAKWDPNVRNSPSAALCCGWARGGVRAGVGG